MLFTKMQLQNFLVLEKKILSLFSIFGHGGHLVQWHGTIQTNCQYTVLTESPM